MILQSNLQHQAREAKHGAPPRTPAHPTLAVSLHVVYCCNVINQTHNSLFYFALQMINVIQNLVHFVVVEKYERIFDPCLIALVVVLDWITNQIFSAFSLFFYLFLFLVEMWEVKRHLISRCLCSTAIVQPHKTLHVLEVLYLLHE